MLCECESWRERERAQKNSNVRAIDKERRQRQRCRTSCRVFTRPIFILWLCPWLHSTPSSLSTPTENPLYPGGRSNNHEYRQATADVRVDVFPSGRMAWMHQASCFDFSPLDLYFYFYFRFSRNLDAIFPQKRSVVVYSSWRSLYHLVPNAKQVVVRRKYQKFRVKIKDSNPGSGSIFALTLLCRSSRISI